MNDELKALITSMDSIDPMRFENKSVAQWVIAKALLHIAVVCEEINQTLNNIRADNDAHRPF